MPIHGADLPKLPDSKLKRLADHLVQRWSLVSPEDREALRPTVEAVRDEMARRLERGGGASVREPRRPHPAGGAGGAGAQPPLDAGA